MSKSGDAIMRGIRKLVEKSGYERFSDRDLLTRFTQNRDEAAFAVLMRRHMSMVLGVGLRVLHHHQDAEDVCQATFLLLARKANTTAWRDSIANWLYEAAYRLCLNTRESTNRRNARERKVPLKPVPDAMADITLRDLQKFLDEEVARLPKKCRAPLVLCCLEGKTRDEAARYLGVPLSTVISRLSEGRDLLRRRLAKRGLDLSLGFAGFTLVSSSARAAVSPKMVSLTSQVAVQVLANNTVPGVLSGNVVALVQKGIQAMFLAKLKVGTAVILAVCLAGGGITTLTQWGLAQNSVKNSQVGAAGDKQLKGSKQQKKLPQVEKADKFEAREALKEAREAADAIVDDPQWKAWILDMIAEAQVRSTSKISATQTLEDAIRVAKEIKSEFPTDPSARAEQTLAGIACTQVMAGDLKGALKTAEAIDNEARREHAQADIARAQARVGDVKGALAAAETMAAKWKDYVLVSVATVLAEGGNVTESERIVESIGSDEERAVPLAALARAQAKKKNMKAARQTIQKALEMVKGIDDSEPGDRRSSAFFEISKAQADMGDFKGARTTVEAIKDFRWKGPALGSIAAAQSAAGSFKEALQTVEEIEKDYYKGEALTDILAVQILMADLKSAQETADSIQNVSWHMKALIKIAKAQAKTGDRITAAKTLKKAFDKGGVDGNEIWDEEPGLGVGGIRNATLSLIMQAKVENGEIDEAFAWAKKQASPELRAIAFIRIAKGIDLRMKAAAEPKAEVANDNPQLKALILKSEKESKTPDALPRIPAAPSRPEELLEFEKKIRTVYEQVLPSVALIQVGPKNDPVGSAVTVSDDGLVLTHAHSDKLLPGAPVSVVFGDGRKATGKVLGVHRFYDQTLVKLDGNGVWPAAALGDTCSLKVGEPCLAVGYPVAHTTFYGERYQKGQPPLLRLGQIFGVHGHYVMNSCNTSGGDSGGPLFNMKGELLGTGNLATKIVNSERVSVSGHISVDVFRKIRLQLLEEKEFTDDTLMKTFERGRPFANTEGLKGLATPVHRSVVTIFSKKGQIGLGLVIAADGRIVTKASQLSGPIICHFADGRRLEASIEAESQKYDLALLKVPANDLIAAPWSDGPPVSPVARVVASIGPQRSPISFGVVCSAVEAVPPVKGALAMGLPEVFAHDGTLSRDQCGGPVVDATGKVVGINIATRVFDDTRTYAIPATIVQKTVEELRKKHPLK